MLIYVNITERQTDGRTDRQTHQKYRSEPNKMHDIFIINASFISFQCWHLEKILVLDLAIVYIPKPTPIPNTCTILGT